MFIFTNDISKFLFHLSGTNGGPVWLLKFEEPKVIQVDPVLTRDLNPALVGKPALTMSPWSVRPRLYWG